MKRFVLLFLTFFAALPIANTQYNQTVVIPSPEAGGTPTTAMLNMAGISAVVRKEKETNKILIVQVLPEGAAEKAGLLAKDYIVNVEGKPVYGMELQPVVAMLRGDPGTKVKVTITREALPSPTDFIVTRELVRLKEVPSK